MGRKVFGSLTMFFCLEDKRYVCPLAHADVLFPPTEARGLLAWLGPGVPKSK
jgi:hypothetical protein